MDLGDREIEELARLIGMLDDPFVRTYLHSPFLRRKPNVRERLLRMLEIQRAILIQEYHPFLPGPQRQRAESGIVEVGAVVTGQGPAYPYRFSEEAVTQHILIQGPPGFGKTHLMLSLSIQLYEKGFRPWWFDTEGEVARVVLGRCGRGSRPPILLRYKDFRRNFFRGPKGVNPADYITLVTALLRETDYCKDGSVNLLRDVCARLMERKPHFSIGDVFSELQRMRFRMKGRDYEYWLTLCNRLKQKLQYLGMVYDVAAGHDLGALLDESVIWDLRGLSTDNLSFFLGDIFLWVSMYRPSFDKPKLLNVFCIDEVARVCSLERQRRADFGEPYFYDAARTFRRRGVGFIVCTQTPHLLPRPVLSSLDSWIIFRPNDGPFRRLINDSLALDPEQQRALARLGAEGRRQVVVRSVSEAEPFLVEVPDFSFPLATAKEIEQHLERSQGFLDSIYEGGGRGNGSNPVGATRHPDETYQDDRPDRHRLSKEEIDYLVAIASRPFLPVTERDEHLRISKGRGFKMRQNLEAEGLIRTHRLATGRRGGPLAVLELTDRAYALLDDLEVRYERPRGHGSYCHKFWQHRILAFARARGWPARIEDSRTGGKSVDVSVKWEERHTAVEVVIEGIEKEIGNLARDLDAGYDRVIFCAADDKTLVRLKKLIEKHFGTDLLTSGRVAFLKLATFLEAPSGQRREKDE